MSGKSYHHGDLKNALIEAGIEMINETGEDQLSLRKVAARCGVSSAAPYAHFANKEEMLQAMQAHVTEGFMKTLKEAGEPYIRKGQPEEALIMMGQAYVLYFIDNPAHYYFLFSQPCMKVNLTISERSNDDFPPYLLMRDTLLLWSEGLQPRPSDIELENRLIHMWACVHGLAAMAIMKTVTWNREWKTEIRNIIK